MMSQRFCLLVFAALVATPLFTTPAWGQTTTEEYAADAMRRTTAAAATYRFEIDSQEERMAFQDRSLLRWSNPVIGEIHGNVYVATTQDGLPVVVGSLLQWYSPHKHGTHELHSLTERPISGYREGQLVWTHASSGIEWKTVAEFPVAVSAPARLRQMRQIAQKIRIRSTNKSASEFELRLLTQPLYRHVTKDDPGSEGITDLGVFTFVQGTDPEVILLTRARRKADGTEQWEIAFAQMANLTFDATLNDRPIWRVDAVNYGNLMQGTGRYVIFRTRPTQSAEPVDPFASQTDDQLR